MNSNTLHTIQDIKNYFNNDDTAYYFISATNFNLMAISDWVNQWFNINLIDCYDSNNNSLLQPEVNETPIFNDIESINQFLLTHKKITQHISNHCAENKKSKAIFLFYNPQLEEDVKSLGMDLIMPPNDLVKHIDNKITTTEIGNSVQVPSVPNALLKIKNYSHLKAVINEHNLGDSVVIQTAYGDSGKTTFFIRNENDYHIHADEIEAEDKVKIMKHIPCLQVAMEACATRNGTYIGPILTEIIGHPKLTPYRGGWCGNDVNPKIFDKPTQKTMYQYSERLGKALYKAGYRGYFEVDYLIDTSDRNNFQVYLGEINPRVTGISAITNMSDFCNQNIPLFLFHLLEYNDTDFALSTDDFNRSVQEYEHPEFGQLIFKYTDSTLKKITSVPKTGIYLFNNGQLHYKKYADNPRTMDKNEIFILRIIEAGEYVYKGADLIILFANHLLQDSNNQLTPMATSLISATENIIEYRELTDEEKQLTERYGKYSSLKSSENKS